MSYHVLCNTTDVVNIKEMFLKIDGQQNVFRISSCIETPIKNLMLYITKQNQNNYLKKT